MAHNQDKKAIPSTQMDSRKFLGALNKSAQARVHLFESLVKNLGHDNGYNWGLAALHSGSLIIEDIDTKQYLIANHHQAKGGRITINNVRKVEIVDTTKRPLFEQNCSHLVKAIEENDRKGMQTAFTRLAAQRFTGSTIPESGYVRTKDGVTRKVPVARTILTDDTKKRLVSAIVESLSPRTAKNNNGRIVGSFGPAVKIKLPVTEWTCRKVIGRMMRDTANNAYKSAGFQNRIHHLASLVNNKKIDEAKQAISGFLKEQQEFCMLNRQQTQTLIENTLATKAIFNQKLCNDVTKLFYKTNIDVNRNDIINEWRATAKKVSNVNLLENVSRLENASNFDNAYDSFLNMVFIEAVSPREVMVDAYRTALIALQQSPQIKESPDLAGKIQQLVSRLSESAVDHAVIAEVEDVLASAKSEMDAGATLDSFDTMPGGDMTLGDEVGDAMEEPEQPSVNAGGKGVSIVINSPLINVGEEPTGNAPDDLGMGDDLGLGDDLGMDDGLGMDDDLDDEFGEMGGEQEGEDEDPDDLRNELDSLEDDEDDEVKLSDFDESADPYAFKPLVNETIFGADYGMSALTNAADINAVVESMVSMATSLDEEVDYDAARQYAVASLKQIGITVPENRLDETVELLTNEFYSKLKQLGEDQYKWSTTAATSKNRSGYKKNRIKTESKNSVEWYQHDEIARGVAGRANGVNFSFDYAEPFALLSEGGDVVIPVPTNLTSSAKAVFEGKGDRSAFEKWILEGIEQLRPESYEDNRLIDEAVATIRATPDGGLEVEIDADDEVGVSHNAGGGELDPMGGGDMMGEPEPGAEGAEVDLGADSIGGEVEGDMAPVDSIPDDAEVESDEDGSMPDFEGEEGGEIAGDFPAETDDEGGEEGEEDEFGESVERGSAIGEDNDVTNPKQGKFTSVAKADPRKMDSPPKPGKSKNKLKGFDKEKDTSTKVNTKMKEVKPGENLP